jgi:hypothetical protein
VLGISVSPRRFVHGDDETGSTERGGARRGMRTRASPTTSGVRTHSFVTSVSRRLNGDPEAAECDMVEV